MAPSFVLTKTEIQAVGINWFIRGQTTNGSEKSLNFLCFLYFERLISEVKSYTFTFDIAVQY